MDISFNITIHCDDPKYQLVEADIPVVSYACFCIMADAAEVNDEDDSLKYFHYDLIAKKFPDYATRAAFIYASAKSLLGQLQNTFEDVANGTKY
jgi:hypothetical protein